MTSSGTEVKTRLDRRRS